MDGARSGSSPSCGGGSGMVRGLEGMLRRLLTGAGRRRGCISRSRVLRSSAGWRNSFAGRRGGSQAVAMGVGQGDEDGLGDFAVCEVGFWPGDVDAVALGSPVESFVVGPDGFEGVVPGGAEVAKVLAVFVAPAKVTGVNGEGRLLTDARQLAAGQGPQALGRGDGARGLAARWAAVERAEVRSTTSRRGRVCRGVLEASAVDRGRGAGHCSRVASRGSGCVLELVEVRLAAGDKFSQVVVGGAYGFVRQAGCGLGQDSRHGRVGEAAIDRRCWS